MTHVGIPDGLDVAVRNFLDTWLTQFSWRGVAVSAYLDSVVGVRGDLRVPFYGDGLIAALDFPVREADLATDISEDEFHPFWCDVLEEFHAAEFSGEWLHPDTRWVMNPIAWSRGYAALSIGTLDRNDPTAPRRYDASLSSTSHDLGVVVFPMRAHARVPELAAMGHAATDIARYVVLSSVVEAGVHEAMEMHQLVPGVPVWDPHAPGRDLGLFTTFVDGVRITADRL